MRIAIVNTVWSEEASTADATLDRFPTLTGWANAVADAGAAVCVFQRFAGAAAIRRRAVDYRFIADRGPARLSASSAGSAALHRAVAEWRPDVVHVNGLDHPRVIRALRNHLRDAAIAVQDHGGFDPASLSPLRRRWMRFGLAAADALLVATAHQVSEFQRLAPPTTMVHDVMEGSTDLRVERVGDRENARAILCVGRLNRNKDPLTVLRGFAAFAARHGDATLTFAYGTGELEPQLRTAIAGDERLRSRVRLLGAVPHHELASVYGGADVLVLGSHHEGSGYAVIEALACGVVPAVTDIAPFRTLTDEGRVGTLWPVGRADALAAALERIASRALPAQRDACRELFARRFSWDAIGRRAVEIYRAISRG